jgi:hypothetical protein
VEIPSAATVKCLGLHLDNKLNWKAHIAKKRKQMDLRFKELWWLLGRKSRLSVNNKLLLYKSIIASIWSYGIELWGCASKSNVAIIQRCQSKILRAIVEAPTVCHQCHAPHRPGYSNYSRSHARQKYRAPSTTTFPLEPATSIPFMGYCLTQTETTVAS